MPGWIAFASLIGVILASLAGLVAITPEIDLVQIFLNENIARIVSNTLLQAALSTAVSLGLAIPFARALARRRYFWGRRVLIRLSSLSLVIPTMVAVFGIAAVYGRNGWLNATLSAFGVENTYSVYGLKGILIAHVFFNLPLATRVFLNAIDSLPNETWRLASQLGLSPSSIFRTIEWPLLRAIIPGIAGLIFMLCFTSFAIVLALGGGPKWSTLEVAIYQALRFDFDIGLGVSLAIIQLGICLSLVLIFSSTRREFSFHPVLQTMEFRPDIQHAGTRCVDTLVIVSAAVFLLSPLLAVLLKSASPAFLQVLGNPAFIEAAQSSLIISFSAAIFCVLLSLPIAFLHKNLQFNRFSKLAGILDASSMLILVVPPLTLGMGLFLLLRAYASMGELGLFLVILVNALLAVPFVLRIIQPAIVASAKSVDRLSLSLGIQGWTLFRLVYWPQIRQAVGFAMALAATLSMGDMGVIALFGTQDLSTLPLLIYRLFGAYRMEEAAVVAMLLCLLCFGLFWLIETAIGGRNAN